MPCPQPFSSPGCPGRFLRAIVVGLCLLVVSTAHASDPDAKHWIDAELRMEHDPIPFTEQAERELQQPRKDGDQRDRLRALRSLGMLPYAGRPTLTPALISEGIALARELDDTDSLCFFLVRAGSAADGSNRASIDQAIALANQHHLQRSLGRIYLIAGNRLRRVGIEESAPLEFYGKAYAAFEAAQDRYGMSVALFFVTESMGETSSGPDEYKKITEHLHHALALIDPATHRQQAVRLYEALGKTYWRLHDVDHARQYLTQALRLGQTLKVPGTIIAAGNLGHLAFDEQRYDEALQWYDTAISEFNAMPLEWQRRPRVHILVTMFGFSPRALTLARLNRYKESLEALSHVDMKNVTQESDQLDHLERASEIYQRAGEYQQAYETLVKYHEVKAKLLSQERQHLVDELKARFNVRLKDSENAVLRAQKKQAEANRQVAEAKQQEASARLAETGASLREAEAQRAQADAQRREADARRREAELQQKRADENRVTVMLVSALGMLLLAITALYLRKRAVAARLEASHQASLAAAEMSANAAKTEFLSNMSHELRSPLNAILGFTRIAARASELPPQLRTDLQTVVRSGEHLYDLINQVLDLSKIEAGRGFLAPIDTDLYALLEELEDLFSLAARQKGLQLAIDSDPRLPRYIRVDAGKLRQVLINLIGNALKFTREGSVTLRVRAVGEAQLAFEVEDTGAGIAAEELSRLCQPFVQAQAGRQIREGTGLGLAISRGFVKLMGGDLEIRSELGRGTVIAFAIPVEVGIDESRVSELDRSERQVLALAGGQPRYRILAVDDREEGRQLLTRLLTPLGFEVREAANGQEAVEVWRDWQPHLIFMDMRMPVMDGREAARKIRSEPRGAQTAIVALTASSFQSERQGILDAGCDDFLRKPFREPDLFRMIERHIGAVFEYDDAVRDAPAEVDPDALAALPQAVRLQLREALQRLDIDAIQAAIAEVQTHDARLAQALEMLANDYQYSNMLQMLAAGETEPAS